MSSFGRKKRNWIWPSNKHWLADHWESCRSRTLARPILGASSNSALPGGLVSKGKPLERLIRKAARALHDYQVAKLWKIPTDFKMLGDGELAFGEEQPADFMGHTVGGRAIMVEAKMHCEPRLPIGSKSGVTPYQWTSLLECHKAMGLALIVWQRGAEIAVFDMDVACELSKKRRSIPWGKIQKRFLHSMESPSVHLDMFEPYLLIMKG
jgi:hypothetical protein